MDFVKTDLKNVLERVKVLFHLGSISRKSQTFLPEINSSQQLDTFFHGPIFCLLSWSGRESSSDKKGKMMRYDGSESSWKFVFKL